MNENLTGTEAYLVLSLAELEKLVQTLKEKRGENLTATLTLRSSLWDDGSGKVQFRSSYTVEV